MPLHTGSIKYVATNTEPTSTQGNTYYDLSEKRLKHYDGTSWRVVSRFNRKVARFVESTDYIDVGGPEPAYRFMANADALSVSVWFKADVNATQCLFSLNDDTGGHHNYIIYLTAGTLKVVHIASGEENSIDYSMTYLNQWHHVIWAVGAGTGGGAELFVDGVSRGTTSVTMSGRSGSTYQDLGHIGRYTVNADNGSWSDLTGYDTAGQMFSGLVSNVSIWDTKIDLANAIAIYNSGVPLASLQEASGNYNAQGNLQGWWKLDKDYNDSSGNNRHGTNQGTIIVDTIPDL